MHAYLPTYRQTARPDQIRSDQTDILRLYKCAVWWWLYLRFAASVRHSLEWGDGPRWAGATLNVWGWMQSFNVWAVIWVCLKMVYSPKIAILIYFYWQNDENPQSIGLADTGYPIFRQPRIRVKTIQRRIFLVVLEWRAGACNQAANKAIMSPDMMAGDGHLVDSSNTILSC